MPPLPLFVFGTLRRGECNHTFLSGNYDRMRPAQLSGFAGVAPLMIAREPGSVVIGELYDLAPATYSQSLQGCDRLEEIPEGDTIGHEYRRIPVRVQTDSGEVIAWAYVRTDVEPDEDLRNLLDAELVRRRRTASKLDIKFVTHPEICSAAKPQNSKSQIPLPKEIPNSKSQIHGRTESVIHFRSASFVGIQNLEADLCWTLDLGFLWALGFGHWDFLSERQNFQR